MKELDITQTGPMGYKDLQAQNNSQYDDIDNFINESRSRILSAARQSDPYRDAPQLVQSSLSNTNTAWGESLFDNNTANQADFEHLGDVRATNQPWISKLSSGIAKGVGLAGTTFLDGTLGLLYGGIQAIRKGDISQLWDNEISNGLQEFNRSMEEFLPNYRTEAEQIGPWWKNLGTINFWADNFLKNLGFTVGAFYSGGVFTKGISLTGKALQAAGKGLKAANAMNKAAMASTKLGKGVESLGRAMQTNGLGAKLTGSLFSAVNEGRIEANNTIRDLRDLQVQQASDAYEMKKQEILENPFLPKEVKIAKLDTLDNNYDATLAQIDDNLKKVGLTTLALNIPILTLNNFWTFGRMYAQGFSNAKNVTTHNVKKSWLGRVSQAANEAAEASENALKSNTLKEAGKFTWNTITKKQAFGRGVVTGIIEGNEEMAQALAAEFAGNQQFYTDGPNVYYKAMSNPEALQNTMNSWEALSKAFINTYGNGDRYEEFAVGALTGLLGIPTFGKSQNSSANTWLGRGKSFGISGGIIGEFTSSADMNKKGAAHVENMNALINKREQIDKAARIQSAMTQFTDAMNGFAEADDKFEFQNASDNIDWMGITSFISTGREEDLKTILGQDFDNISDEELEAIAKFTAQRDDSNIGGFREKGSGKLITATSPQSDKDAMKEKLNKAKERMLEEIESYKSSVDLMRNYAAGSPHVTEEKLNELAWMHWKTNRFSSRVNEIKTENADKFILIAQALEDFKAKQQKILDTKAESTEGLSINALAAAENRNTNLAKSKETARKNLTYVDELLGVINSVASSNKAVMSFLAPMLQMDKDFLTGLLTSNNFYDVAIARGISKPEFDKVIRDIRDLGRLADANKTFNDKLKEYMEDPLKQDKDHEKIDAENEAVGQEINKETARKKAKQVTREQILNGEADADEVIKNTKTTDIERNLAKDAKVTKQVRTQIETMLAKQQQEGTITNEDARIVEETIAQAIAKSNSINELTDSNASFMVDAHGQPLSDAQLVLVQNLMETAVKAVAEAEDLNITDGKIDFNKVEEAVEAHINGPSKASVDAIEKVADVPTAGNDAVEKAVAVNRGTNTNTVEQALKKSKNPNQKQKQRDEKATTRAAKEKDRLEAQAAKKNKIIATALVYASHSNDLNLSTQEGQKGTQLISDMLSKAYDLLQQGKITKLSGIMSVLKSMDEYEKFQQLFGIDPVLGAALTSLSENMQINLTKDNESDDTAELDSIIGPETINDATADPTEYSSQNLNPAINIPNYFAPATSQFYKDPKTGRISPEPFTKKVTIGNKARKKKLEATYNYLAEKQAFKNASQVKVGQDIYFTIHPNLNTAAGGIVILMSTDKEGKHIVGDLADTESVTYQNNLLLKATVDRITKEFNDRADKTSSEPFVSKETSTVRQTMLGHVLFSNSTKAAEDLFLNKVFGDGGFKMGVVNRAGDVITTNQGNENVSGELNVVKPNTRFKPGTPVVLIPSGEGTNVYIAVPFQMDKYTSAMKGSKFHKYAETILKRVLLNSNGEALDFRDQKPQILVKNALNSLFNGSFHVNFRKGQLVIHQDLQTVKDGVVEKTKDVLFTGSPNSNLVTDILQALQDKEMTIRIDRREINKNSNLKDLDFTYNTIMGDLAHTNLLPQSATTVNDWFIINPLNEEGEEININRVPYNDSRVDTRPKQRNDTVVTYNNNEYIVSDEDVIIDKDGNPRTDINVSDQQIILAKVEISKNEFATPIGFEGDQIFWYSLSNGSLFYNKAGKEKIVASESEKQEIINNLTTNKNSSESTDKRYPKEFYSQAQKDFFDAMPQERQKLLLQANPNAITAVLPYIDTIMKNFGLEDLEEIEDDINNIFDLLTSNKYRRVSEEDGYTPIDLNTEIAWLKKALPQLSDNDHLRIVTGLIKISQQSNPGYAYGKTQKGIMTVSNAAATGTVYHEAFHSVIDTLLTDEEISDLFIAGAKKYSIERDSINNELAIEENLAEDFRRYVQREQAYKEDVQQSSGISKIFKMLKHTIKIWLENTSYINNMFYRINKGKLANRAVVNNRNTERFNQYTDEEKHILDRAPRDSQGRLLAPNGEVSNLTEKQYAQVRTKAFKDWFGDWEQFAPIKDIPIDKDKYYRVTTISELNNALNTGKLSTPAISMFDNAILDKIHKHTNISFEELENLNRTKEGQEQIRKIWRDNNIGILVPRTKSNHGDIGFQKGSPYYKINNANEGTVVIVSNNNKTKFLQGHHGSYSNRYNEDINVGEPVVLREGFESLNFDFYKKTEKGWIKVNNDNNASKVVDENGEPLVVYTGVPIKGLTEFSLNTPNRASLTSTLKKGIYFSDKNTAKLYKKGNLVYKTTDKVNAEQAKKIDTLYWAGESYDIFEEYVGLPLNIIKEYIKQFTNEYTGELDNYSIPEGEVISAFLNIKNPVKIQHNGTSIIHLSEEDKIKINNSEGAIIKDVDEHTTDSFINTHSTDYIVFNSNQIKSATDNIGTFDANNPDIRYRKVPSIAELRAQEKSAYDRFNNDIEEYYREARDIIKEVNYRRFNTEREAMKAFNESGIRKDFFYRITREGANNAAGYKIQLLTRDMVEQYKQDNNPYSDEYEDYTTPIENFYFDSLGPEIQMMLFDKGWTKEQFDSISQQERDQAVKCIAL